MKKVLIVIGIIVFIVLIICIIDVIKIANSPEDDCCTCPCSGEYCVQVCCTCANTLILPNVSK